MEKVSKKKENSIQTRQDLLDAAFDNFYTVGLENVSLEKISKDAKVSRGAAYWHFKNKQDLFKQTVIDTLENIRKKKEPIYQDSTLDFKDKVVKMILLPYKDRKYYAFIQQAAVSIHANQEFEDLADLIEESRVKLYTFFKTGVEELQEKNIRLKNCDSAVVASLLYSYFEGMHSSDTPTIIAKNYTIESIKQSIGLILNDDL